MKGIALFFESDKGLYVKNFIIGVGAAVVIIGALFKLMSWPGAGPLLIAGLGTEAFIFALQGILPPHPNYHWEKFYPGITVHPHFDEGAGGKSLKKQSVTEQLDEMLESANLESQIIERLGTNLGKLGSNVEKMTELGDASVATSEYAEKTKEAISALVEMKNAYSTATSSVNSLAASTEQFQAYQAEISSASENLASLNKLYENELSATSSNLKALNDNLAGLNQVYGNMLSAMNPQRG